MDQSLKVAIWIIVILIVLSFLVPLIFAAIVGAAWWNTRPEGLMNDALPGSPVLVVVWPRDPRCEQSNAYMRPNINALKCRYRTLKVMEATGTGDSCEIMATYYPFGIGAVSYPFSEYLKAGPPDNWMWEISSTAMEYYYCPTLMVSRPLTIDCPPALVRNQEAVEYAVRVMARKSEVNVLNQWNYRYAWKNVYTYYPRGLGAAGITMPATITTAVDIIKWINSIDAAKA